MRLVNLTPHAVTVYGDGKPIITLPPSGTVARITERLDGSADREINRDTPEQIAAGLTWEDVYAYVPVTRLLLAGRKVTGLPDEAKHAILDNGPNDSYDMGPGLGYLVSRLVAEALPQRWDLFCPGPEIRDQDGRIIGCTGLYSVQP